MRVSKLFSIGALTVAASVVGAQDAGKLNGTVQILAGKIVDQTTPNNLPKGGEKIQDFNGELTAMMQTIRGGIEDIVTDTPDGQKKRLTAPFIERQISIGGTPIWIGIGRIRTDNTSVPGLQVKMQ